jgi:nucleotide-binding universal stress UspA family protein
VGSLNYKECHEIILRYLIKWEVIQDDDSVQLALKKFHISIVITKEKKDELLSTIVEHLKKYPHSLLVLATAGRSGLPRWFHPSIAEKIALRSRLPAVFISEHCVRYSGIKNPDFEYRKILVPVDQKPDPQISIHLAYQIAGLTPVITEIMIFHAGDITQIPLVKIPAAQNCIFRKSHESGDPVERIIAAAKEFNANLMIMSTAGRKGIMEALNGSVTEKVIRQSPCPVITVPMQPE